jgi:hypothetical protein
MRRPLHVTFALVAASFTWMACSSSPPDAPQGALPGLDAGAGVAPGDGGSGPAADSGAAPTTPAGICAQYVACVAATTPAGLGVVAEAYGKDGTCWKTLDAETCKGACKTGIVQTHKAFPKAEACDLCDSSADCPSEAPVCDPSTRRCFECAGAADCAKKPGKACNTATRTCVECTADADCTQRPDRPVCDTTTNTCAECATNQDCRGGFSTQVCDATTRTCRSCVKDSECGGGVCDRGACLQCRTSADCPASAPTCNGSGACVACTDGSTCPSGACSMRGTCCDPNTCAKMKVQCGYTIDIFGCGLLTEIPCGACPGAQNCVHSTCVDPPANHCGAKCSGRCGYVPETNSYECVSVSSSCNTKANIACSAGFACQQHTDSVTGVTYDLCVDYCLVDADCKGGTCQSQSGVKGLGTCG